MQPLIQIDYNYNGKDLFKELITEYVRLKQRLLIRRMMKITRNRYNAIMRNSSFTFEVWRN